MPPSFDKPGVRLGRISETCSFNDHADCRVAGCACDCHILATQAEVKASFSLKEVEGAAGKPEKACPKCGVKRPFTETFCRIDGERLASLICTVCGAGMEVEDAFCWGCGCGASKGTLPKSTVINVPELNAQVDGDGDDNGDGEVDYGAKIVRDLQAEMTGEDNYGNKGVVETPVKEKGSFTLVSKPSSERLRTGERVGVPGPPSINPPNTPGLLPRLPKSGSQSPSGAKASSKLPPKPPKLPIKPS